MRFRLENDVVAVDVLDRGARIQRLLLKDRGSAADVVLGLPRESDYDEDRAFLGAVVGRYANRIAHGSFTLDGTTYALPRNERGNTLHGGPDGFDRRRWRPVTPATDSRVVLELISPDGDMGFPGALTATCGYHLDGPELRIELRAHTDRPTPVNLTQHAYFNLAGHGTATGHELWVDADRYLPTDETGIPLAADASVAGTPVDFRTPTVVGARLDDPALESTGGYDHCVLLDEPRLDHVSARLVDPVSGRVLEVLTDQPALQVFTGNALDRGTPFPRHGAVCLEAQRVPDGPNRPDAADVVLRPGEEYVARTTWRFGTRD